MTLTLDIDALTTKAILTLWHSGGAFDTHDIARLLHLHESEVDRVLHLSRAVRRELVNEGMGEAAE